MLCNFQHTDYCARNVSQVLQEHLTAANNTITARDDGSTGELQFTLLQNLLFIPLARVISHVRATPPFLELLYLQTSSLVSCYSLTVHARSVLLVE